jgi:hypothetical protein
MRLRDRAFATRVPMRVCSTQPLPPLERPPLAVAPPPPERPAAPALPPRPADPEPPARPAFPAFPPRAAPPPLLLPPRIGAASPPAPPSPPAPLAPTGVPVLPPAARPPVPLPGLPPVGPAPASPGSRIGADSMTHAPRWQRSDVAQSLLRRQSAPRQPSVNTTIPSNSKPSDGMTAFCFTVQLAG